MTEADMQLIPEFFSPVESDRYLKDLLKTIPWNQKKIMIFGKPVLEPRLTAWIGDPGAAYSYSGIRMVPRPWTKTLLEIKTRVEKAAEEKFNSVLANLYRDHLDSMGLHSDDEKELGENPIIASVSLGAARKFILKHKTLKGLPPKNYLLESGSLLIMRGKTQQLWKHGIPKDSRSCGPRINLTFRKIVNLA